MNAQAALREISRLADFVGEDPAASSGHMEGPRLPQTVHHSRCSIQGDSPSFRFPLANAEAGLR
jgi:hypothetical protein